MRMIVHQNYKGVTPPKDQKARMAAIGVKPRTIYINGLPTRKEVAESAAKFIDGEMAGCFLAVGIATLHPDDEYNRKAGAEIAQNKAKFSFFLLKKIILSKHGYEVTFAGEDCTIDIMYRREKGPTFKNLIVY